jgi:hypothetical protein
MKAPARMLLLGPQRPVQNLGRTFAAGGFPEGPVAVISAGMQEAEGYNDHIQEAIGRPLVDLELYQRAEQLLHKDSQFHEAYRTRQEQFMELQRLYRRRLRPLALAVRDIYRTQGDAALLAPERRHALSQLRALDQHHLNRIEQIHSEFEAKYGPDSYDPLAENTADIAHKLSQCGSLLITGGNVIILVNRMRMFGLGKMLPDRPLVAFSAGAMVLTDRIILFHDRTPQGRRDPEVLSAGFGILPGYLFFPDAERRLRVGDKMRTGLLKLRMSPDVCLALDNGSAAEFEGTRLLAAENIRLVNRSGQLEQVEAA